MTTSATSCNKREAASSARPSPQFASVAGGTWRSETSPAPHGYLHQRSPASWPSWEHGPTFLPGATAQMTTSLVTSTMRGSTRTAPVPPPPPQHLALPYLTSPGLALPYAHPPLVARPACFLLPEPHPTPPNDRSVNGAASLARELDVSAAPDGPFFALPHHSASAVSPQSRAAAAPMIPQSLAVPLLPPSWISGTRAATMASTSPAPSLPTFPRL